MKDQAEELRLKLRRNAEKKIPKTIAVVSGKGGVGKSNFSLNFSISLAQKGYSVLLFDLDMGMGNLDILMGETSEYSIIDFFEKSVPLKEIIVNSPQKISYITGGTGLSKLVELDADMVEHFLHELSGVMDHYDYVVFDMGAGISNHSLQFILSVQEIIVITTSEPTSITDAYAMMKHIHLLDQSLPFNLVVNRIQTEKEGKQTYNRLANVLKTFLGRELAFLGMIPDDRAVQKAVKSQTPFILFNGRSQAAKSLKEMTEFYCNRDANHRKASSFIARMKHFLFERQARS
jgi:flagellar biosynthesis protein FlhG